MATRPEDLYRQDFYLWAKAQAAALRDLADQHWNGPLDLEHLAEEVESATIRRNVERELAELYRGARRDAELSLLDHGEREAAQALPETCPYQFDDLLADEWWPASRHGLKDD